MQLWRRGEAGFFARDAVIRRVVGERVVGLTYGARASFVGALHPVAMEGTSQSSAGRSRPFQRLGRTAAAFESLIFGSAAEAQTTLDRVAAMHAKVRGTLQVDGGPAFPAGTPYAADDPEAAFWTLAVLVDSAEAIHARLVRPLEADEQEAYWQDFRRFGLAFGLPRSAAPTTYEGFREAYEDLLSSGRLHLTATGYEAGLRVGLRGPLPPPLAGPLQDVMYLIVVGTVPTSVRRAYGVGWTPAHGTALAGLATASRTAHRLTPSLGRRGSVQPLVRAIVAEERRRIRDGRAVWAEPSAAHADRPDADAGRIARGRTTAAR